MPWSPASPATISVTVGQAPWRRPSGPSGPRTPGTTVEVLISDCRGDAASLDTIFEARPDVLNHNIETVARLQRAVRPSAGYARSLAVLARAGQAGLVTKSGLMVGLGEREDEVVATIADLRGVGVSIVTVGQYLRPSRDHLPVSRYWAPEEFDRLRDGGDGARRGPRGGITADEIQLSRPRGGHGGRSRRLNHAPTGRVRSCRRVGCPLGPVPPSELSLTTGIVIPARWGDGRIGQRRGKGLPSRGRSCDQVRSGRPRRRLRPPATSCGC